MPDIKTELMKLNNLQFDDDVESSPITTDAETERKKIAADKARERYHAKKAELGGKSPRTAKVMPVVSVDNVETLLATMPIKVAKALYLELKKVFEA